MAIYELRDLILDIQVMGRGQYVLQKIATTYKKIRFLHYIKGPQKWLHPTSSVKLVL